MLPHLGWVDLEGFMSLVVLRLLLTAFCWMQLGLRALKKAGREHSMRRFVQDAAAAMPALAADFESIASRRFHVDLNASVRPSCRQFQDFLTSEDNDDQ